MHKKVYEVNFDGIIGPTHNYSGLSFGNVASMDHKESVSNPKKAALQGLKKMHMLFLLGIHQGVLPPHERPHIPMLRTLGYHGSDDVILQQALKDSPALLASCTSSAPMWAANAATVSPSADTLDGLVHFTPANLCSKFHRSFESSTTAKLLQTIFPDPDHFFHHPPLPPSSAIADEAAANHTRFCERHGSPGIEFFVYGRSAFDKTLPAPQRFPARQSDEASRSIARLHRLTPSRVIFAQQNPAAVDMGVFHNDVISVGNENVFLYHEKAFTDTPRVMASLQAQINNMILLPVTEEQVSLSEAVRTYLFNSQLVTLSDGTMALIAPIECKESPSVLVYLEGLASQSNHPIKQILYVHLRESMQNGGGPACLRLRVVLTPKELAAVHSPALLTEDLYIRLTGWVNRHYRDRLSSTDLADPQLMYESREALDDLTRLLKLGSIYSFQT
jgi:succinylarginine dihydrolase